MAEPLRSALQSGVTRVTSSHKSWMDAEEDEEEVENEEAEDGPIFSLSKSSMDVLMATEPMHPWDPALTRQDIRRSSSTNTHTEHNTCTLQQLRARQLQEDAAAANKALPIPQRSPPGPGCGSPPLSERWSSCSTRSDCSTPDSVIWRGGAVRPQSLVQGAPSSKLASPASPLPPFDSPVQTPPISPSRRPSLPLTPCRQQQQPMSSSTPASPTPEVHATPPMPPSTLPPVSPELHRLPSMENEHILTNRCSPSPTLPSHRPISPGRDVGVRTCSQQQAHLDQASEELPSVSGSTHSVFGGEDEHMLLTQLEEQESPRQDKLPWHPGSSCPDFCVSRSWKSPLVSSLSDTGLSVCCRCSCGHSRLEILTSRPQGGKGLGMDGRDEVQGEQEMPRPPVRSVDAAVQTASPPGSWSGLRKNMSYMSNSHMGSHSILGSPPGSRLNLHSPVGSTLNLVSPSSSMFFQDFGEDQEEKEEKSKDSSLVWKTGTAAVEPPGRRRSCLKVQGEDRVRGRGELGRRGSMKQVQWDEEGMTWDVYGSSVEAEELKSAIERHLNLRVGKGRQSPPPPRNKWRIKTGTKAAGTALSQTRAAKATALGHKEQGPATPALDSDGEAKAKAESELEKGKSKKQELAADVCGKRKIEVKREKGNGHGEEEGTQEHKSSPRGSLGLVKAVKWSMRKPCCGGSSKDHH